MDKRCLAIATGVAVLNAIIAMVVLLIFNAIFRTHTFYILVCFSSLYGIGTHLGYSLGFHYKIIPKSLPLFIVIALNFLFIILPLISKQDGSFGINMAIFFDFAFMGNIKKGRSYFDKLEKEDNESKNDDPKAN